MKFHARLVAGALSLSVPCSAGSVKVPASVEGSVVALDPYVQEFHDTMKGLTAETNALNAAILAVSIPPLSKSGAAAAGAAVAAQWAGMAGIMARAESAQDKMLTHIYGNSGDPEIKKDIAVKAPAFEEKKDDRPMRPHQDRILKDTLRPARPASAPNFSAAAAPSVSAAAPSRPSFQRVSSGFGYVASGRSVGVGFENTLKPSSAQGSLPPAIDGSGTTSAGGAAGASNSGSTEGAGLGGGSGTGGSGSDAPSANPAHSQLTSSSSDVVTKAMERMQKKREEAQRRAEKRAQEEKAERERKQQQRQQMAQAMMQGLAPLMQAAQAASSSNEQKSGEATQAEATAPMP